MPYKTAAKRKSKPAAAPAEPTTVERIAAAQRAGNPALAAQLRAEAGLSAPPVYRDALVRTARKPAEAPKAKGKRK